MPDRDYITELLGFQGFYVSGMKIERGNGVEKVIFDNATLKVFHEKWKTLW